jgi:1-phosphofructokinase family hexose kinase
MILTLVPNPALDKTVIVPNFETGRIFRPDQILTLAGGKGFNFARALRLLGEEVQIVATAGGIPGQQLIELAQREKLTTDFLKVGGDTRTCLTIVDPAANYKLTELYEKGSPLTLEEWEELVARLVTYFPASQFLVISGSFPPGVPEDGLYRLVELANTAGVAVLLDTHGPMLGQVLELAPALVKINQHEAADLLKKELTHPLQVLEACGELQKRGAQQVVITLGKQGAVGVSADGQPFGWNSPEVKAISAVGSGDVLLAGIAQGLNEGWKLAKAVRWGVAAGAANTLQLGAGLFDPDYADRLLSEIKKLPVS